MFRQALGSGVCKVFIGADCGGFESRPLRQYVIDF